MRSAAQQSRAIDHLVLPVTDIATARKRLSILGFTVAADARHPFGTENACVFFADKTYLEPLGIASLSDCVAAARDGNVFVARDQMFRSHRGQDGFSGIAVASDDAPSDHKRFVDAGLSAGEMLQFSRPMTMPDGASSVAGFALAFAADAGAPDLLLFAVQRINPLPADRGSLEQHANGVTGISELLLSAEHPKPFGRFFQTVFGADDIDTGDDGLSLEATNARIIIRQPHALAALLGEVSPDGDNGLLARAIVFKVSDLSVTAAVLAANGIATVRNEHHILVSEAPGQGAVFLFEE
jgi:hypothetical protein